MGEEGWIRGHFAEGEVEDVLSEAELASAFFKAWMNESQSPGGD